MRSIVCIVLLVFCSCASEADKRICDVVFEAGEQFLTLSIPEQNAKPGEEFCVPLITGDFEKIISMQYTIRWDPAILKYIRLTGFGAPSLTADNFGRHRVEEGLLTFSWVDGTLSGVDLADGTYLHEICYKAIGESGSNSEIKIDVDPVIIEIYRAPQSEIGLKVCKGVIKIE